MLFPELVSQNNLVGIAKLAAKERGARHQTTRRISRSGDAEIHWPGERAQDAIRLDYQPISGL